MNPHHKAFTLEFIVPKSVSYKGQPQDEPVQAPETLEISVPVLKDNFTGSRVFSKSEKVQKPPIVPPFRRVETVIPRL